MEAAEIVEPESSGPWKLWTMDALDRLDCGSSEQWKPWTWRLWTVRSWIIWTVGSLNNGSLRRGSFGPWKPWTMEAVDHVEALNHGNPPPWKL